MARSARLFQEAHGFPEETFLRTPEFDVNKKNQDELDAFGLIKVDDFGRCIELDHAAIDAAARRYLEYKTAQHLLDFNDLLLKAWAWLDATPEACGRYAWIQVDEVQDLSPLQLDIVKKLWNDSSDRSVCVYFGDEQQAIFSFMGAKLDTLRALHKTHEIHRLYRNFRSPDYLLNMFNTYAQRVLECDPEFLPKAEKTVARPEGALRAIRTATPQSQLMLLCDLLEGRRPEETTAVIVPSNREADAVSAAFKAQDIEHFKISGSDIFRQNILKAAKAYLSVLKDDFRSAPWAQLVYRLSSKKNLSLKKIRDYLAVEFPRRGLLASDLMLYSTHDEKEPVSALEDFMRAYEGELVVFDTETTGLDIGLDEVIQIAAVKLRAGEVVERLVLYLETEREIPKMLGNIPNPMLEEYEAHRDELVTPEAGFKTFLDFVGYAPVVGHNVEYDANIVNAQYSVLKDQLRRVRGDAAGPDEDVDRTELVRRFDTLKLSHALEPAILKAAGLARLPSHKLKDLIAVLGLEGSNTHKADDDVEATVSLLRWFHAQARPLVELQRRFLSNPSVVRMSDTLRKIVLPMFLEHRNLMYRRMPAADEAILVQVFRQFIETLPNYTDDEGEIENIRKAQIKDSVAHVRFMKWLKENVGKETITEMSASDKLDEFRAEMGGFIRPSFGPISAFGEHSAIVHYSSSPETNVELHEGTFLMTDTGAGFYEGSTDITRTYAFGEVSQIMKDHFTLVAISNLNLASPIFKKGCCGMNFDYLARKPFWDRGLDFNHGTGHGVGYLLNIHEGPAGFRYTYRAGESDAFQPGMVITDEPGIYIEGSHGVRLENELLVCEGEKNEYGEFLYFEPITYVPFDLDAINPDIMNAEDKERLNTYHATVYEKVSPYLNDEEKEWLKKYTRAI